jgi:hypothetical protein
MGSMAMSTRGADFPGAGIAGELRCKPLCDIFNQADRTLRQ